MHDRACGSAALSTAQQNPTQTIERELMRSTVVVACDCHMTNLDEHAESLHGLEVVLQ